jgi:hypothetical protein
MNAKRIGAFLMLVEFFLPSERELRRDFFQKTKSPLLLIL